MKKAAFLAIAVLVSNCYAVVDFRSWGTYDSTYQFPFHYFCQCHGDADGLASLGKRVGQGDLDIIKAIKFSPLGWPAYYPGSMTYDARADFDRNFVVNDLDVAILEQWIYKSNVPGDCGKKVSFKTTGSQCLLANTYYNIEWIWQIYTQHIPMPGEEDYPGTFSLYYSTGSGWTHIATVSHLTSYNWLVPNINAQSCQLKIVDDNHSGLGDIMAVNICQCTQNIAADYNKDCYVDILDLVTFCEYWIGDCSEENEWCQGVDYNFTAFVDFVDFSAFAQDWGKCANPCDSNCPQ